MVEIRKMWSICFGALLRPSSAKEVFVCGCCLNRASPKRSKHGTGLCGLGGLKAGTRPKTGEGEHPACGLQGGVCE